MAASPKNPDAFSPPRQRRWRGQLLSPTQEVRMFFHGEGPVPDTLRAISKLLGDAGIAHIFMGATAVNAHGFRRSTEDVDLCMRRADLDLFKQRYVGSRYQPVPGRSRRFYDPTTQVTIDILVAGAIAGDAQRQQAVRFPDPSEAEMHDGIPVPSLARLIELKLVTWRLQDWADVIHLIRRHHLDESFAAKLDPVARAAYLQCYDQMVEEDRYNPEIDDQPA